MKFKKEYLIDILQNLEYETDRIVSNGRWTIQHEMIFKHEDKFYRTYYNVGATECQEEYPFDYEPEEIKCEEVHQVEKIVKVWEKVT